MHGHHNAELVRPRNQRFTIDHQRLIRFDHERLRAVAVKVVDRVRPDRGHVEPLILVVMGFVVGGLLLAVYYPMLSMVTKIG